MFTCILFFLGSKSIGGIVTLKKREHPTRGLSLVYFGVFHRKKLPKLDSQIKKKQKKHLNVWGEGHEIWHQPKPCTKTFSGKFHQTITCTRHFSIKFWYPPKKKMYIPFNDPCIIKWLDSSRISKPSLIGNSRNHLISPCQSGGLVIKESTRETGTLQGINISHLGKRKIIFKMPFLGDMLVPWRVYVKHF